MVRQPDILDRLGALLDRLAPYLIFALLLTAAVGVASAQDMMRVVRGGWRREEAASPYWTDTNTYVALWEFETTNTTQTLDTSGNSYHASNMPTVATGPTWFETSTNQYGRIEHGYSFDGSADCFATSNSAALQLTTGLTMSAWIKPVAIGAFEKIIAKWRDSGTGWAYILQVNTGGELHFDLDTGGTTRLNSGAGVILTNVWQHVAATWDGATQKMYKNGLLIAQQAQVGIMTNDTSRLALGCRWDATLGYRLFYEGSMDNPFVAGYAFPSNAIYTLYQNTHPTNNLRLR